MLVLTRKVGERILIGDKVEAVILSIKGGVIKLGIEAPREMSIHRQENLSRKKVP